MLFSFFVWWRLRLYFLMHFVVVVIVVVVVQGEKYSLGILEVESQFNENWSSNFKIWTDCFFLISPTFLLLVYKFSEEEFFKIFTIKMLTFCCSCCLLIVDVDDIVVLMIFRFLYCCCCCYSCCCLRFVVRCFDD